MINYLVGTRLQQDPIVIMAHTQYFHISKIPVQELLSNISFPEETFQASLKILLILRYGIHLDLL